MKFVIIIALALLLALAAVYRKALSVVWSGGTGSGETTGALLWPVGSGDEAFPIGNAYGQYQKYDSGSGDYHDGIDILVEMPEEVLAIEAGTVAFVSGTIASSLNYGIVVVSHDTPGAGYYYMHFAPAGGVAHKVGDEIAAGERLGWVVAWSDPTDYDHLHLSQVEEDPDASDVSPFPYFYVGNPLRRLKNATDLVDPDAPEILFFQHDSAEKFDIEDEKLTGKVDVVVRVQDRFLDPTDRLLIPFRVVLQIRPEDGTDVVYENEIEFDGHFGPVRVDFVDLVYKGIGVPLKGDYDDREFYVIATNVPPDGIDDGDGTDGGYAPWDTAAHDGPGTYQVHVTVYDASGRKAEDEKTVTVDSL